MAQQVAEQTTAQPSPVPRAWLVVALIIVATFYPGIMSNDSTAALAQARAFEFTDWHPPVLALIWSLLDRIVPGPALMLIGQSLLYAYAAARLCSTAFARLATRLPANLLLLAFALFPPVMALNGMIWKDVWMSGALLLALAYLFELASGTGGTRRSMLVIIAACLLATAFRHNAGAATAGLLAGAVYFGLPGPARPLLRLTASGLAGLALATVLVLVVSMANRLLASPANVTTPILLHDIAGTVLESGEPERAAQLALATSPGLTNDRGRFLARLGTDYHPEEAGRLLRTKRRNPDSPFVIDALAPGHDADAVKRAWRAVVSRYPAAYLRHRAATFACLMQFCGRSSWAIHSYVLNPKYVFPAGLDPGQERLRHLLLNPRSVLLYAPTFWLGIVLVGGLAGLVRLRAGTRPALCVFMALSAVGLAVSLFFTSPIESYRYVHWMILSGWIMLWMLADAVAARRPFIPPADGAAHSRE